MENPPRNRHAVQRSYTTPLLLIAVLSAGFGLTLLFQDQSPVVSELTPRVGNPGEVMVIDGSYFGTDRTRSLVTIAGQRVTASSILEWSPQRISLRIPDEVKSGSVVVQTPAGRSKAQSFTSQNQIPRISQTTQSAISASLISSQPMFCWPGDILVIKGRNMGIHQAGLQVLVDGQVLSDNDILEWGDSSLTIRMPMSAKLGLLKLSSAMGVSNSLSVPIQKGSAVVSAGPEERQYRLRLLFDIGDVELLPSPAWGNITAYMPRPPAFLEQSAEVATTSGATVTRVPPSMIAFNLDKPESDIAYHLTAEIMIKRKAVLLAVSNDPETDYSAHQAMVNRFTGATPLVPASDARLRSFAKAAIKSELRPLAQARLIYQAVLDKLVADQDAGMAFASQVLVDGRATSFGYANLMVGALRAVGIPAQLIEGIVVGSDKRGLSHIWLEFFVPTVGWVQADPSMGDGMYPDAVPLGTSAAAWYFGNIDNRHLALIEGEQMTSLTRYDANAQKLFQHFILMQVHAEASGNVDSYGLFIAPPDVQLVR